MMPPKMLILRGNASAKGTFPDEKGNKIAWPIGALHVRAATDYARTKGYFGVVIDIQGYPQYEQSPQAREVYKRLKADESIAALYGFSGGGYNVRHILKFLAKDSPAVLSRFDLIVVIGSPNPMGKAAYAPSVYNAIARKATARRKVKDWEDACWEVVYRENPHPSQLPDGLPPGLSTHMFGPDLLLAGWPE